jgi:cellobiose-specific phosphotransferase system component IIB
MTKLSKFIYWSMLIICVAGITTGILSKNYNSSIHNFALLMWVAVAFLAEKRCDKLQEKIDELNKN